MPELLVAIRPFAAHGAGEQSLVTEGTDAFSLEDSSVLDRFPAALALLAGIRDGAGSNKAD
jgi:hypothetical protein